MITPFAPKYAKMRITVCTTVVRVVLKSIGNGTFRGAATEKPLNRLTQNLAWVITSGTHSVPQIACRSVQGGGGDPHEGVKC